ncbi:aminopyrimidine aminohydrolase [Vreelandella aquamarina]|nr:aminopyrimidine aminohydrolase [Halomonas axialensis]
MGYRFTDLTTACQDDWRAYIEHDFVRQLGNATLPDASFRHYLKQDYLFLIHFARAYALAAYKSPTLADLRQAHEGLKAIVDVELGLHVGFCQEWGFPSRSLPNSLKPAPRWPTPATCWIPATVATCWICTWRWPPCLVGYGEIANWLNAQPSTLRGAQNPFDAWIAMYEGEEFQAAMQAELAWLDARLADVTPPALLS